MSSNFSLSFYFFVFQSHIRRCYLSLLFFFFFSSPLFATSPKPSTTLPTQDLFGKDFQSWFVSGSFLYWTAVEGGLDYVLEPTSASSSLPDTLPQGKVAKGHFRWDPGYRLAIGYFRAPNFWEICAEYTFIHLKGKETKQVHPITQSPLRPTYVVSIDPPVTRATNDLFLHYKLCNLLVKRVFLLPDNPHLRLRLGGGVTATWLHQSMKIGYFGSSPIEQIRVKNRWRYWGIGPRIETTFDWFWGSDIYLSGLFSTALVVGHYHNQFGQSNGSDQKITRFDDYRTSFHLQFLIGPSYQKLFTKMRMEIFLGYEISLWSNLQEVYRSTSSDSTIAPLWINKSPVGLHGLNGRLSFNF